MKTNVVMRRWAKRHVLAEVKELLQVGHAANVQDWMDEKQINRAECVALRREARRLIRLALRAVEVA